MKYSDICGKEVINIHDGSLVGIVQDIAFDACTYVIFALYVQPAASFVKKIFPWFFSTQEIEIVMDEIINIQGDVILVKYK